MNPRKRITNTAALPPEINLLTGMLPGGIEASERAGQRQLLESCLLPSRIEGREAFLAAGGTLGEAVNGDPLFLEASLPPGWKRVKSDHPMWTYLEDERGRQRASIFYKAAFYDRDAHMRMHERFHVGGTSHYEAFRDRPDSDMMRLFGYVRDSTMPEGQYLFQTETITVQARDERWPARDRLKAEAQAWLDANVPVWNDPVASWGWDAQKVSETK